MPVVLTVTHLSLAYYLMFTFWKQNCQRIAFLTALSVPSRR